MQGRQIQANDWIDETEGNHSDHGEAQSKINHDNHGEAREINLMLCFSVPAVVN